METIRFTNEVENEKGLRIMVINGPVVFTGNVREYKVPNYVISLLDEQHIGYEILNHQNSTLGRPA